MTSKLRKQWKAGVDRIMKAWEEEPLLVLTVVAGTLVAVARIVDSLSSVQSKRAYARKMGRR